MNLTFRRFNPLFTFAASVIAVLLVGCAPSVKVRSDADPGVNMSQYQTYDFFSQLGVEGDSYSNLVGRHFRDAISFTDGRARVQ